MKKGPTIANSEVVHSIKSQKNRKATGSNKKVHSDVFKTVANQEVKGLMLDLFNTICSIVKIPSDWFRSAFVTIPKKPNLSQCDDYPIIGLMSHVFSVFLRTNR